VDWRVVSSWSCACEAEAMSGCQGVGAAQFGDVSYGGMVKRRTGWRLAKTIEFGAAMRKR
jgi:hypothetical protein